MAQMQQMRTQISCPGCPEGKTPLCLAIHCHPQIWQDIIMCDLAPSLEAILNGWALSFADFGNFLAKNELQVICDLILLLLE